MSAPRNEHEDFDAYQFGGLDAVVGIPRERAMKLAEILTLKADEMDPRHPSTEIVKRDVTEIYARLNPESQPATSRERGQAQNTIDQLLAHPAYTDPAHPQHQEVKNDIGAAYAVRYQGED